jgi:hypothetical protein
MNKIIHQIYLWSVVCLGVALFIAIALSALVCTAWDVVEIWRQMK